MNIQKFYVCSDFENDEIHMRVGINIASVPNEKCDEYQPIRIRQFLVQKYFMLRAMNLPFDVRKGVETRKVGDPVTISETHQGAFIRLLATWISGEFKLPGFVSAQFPNVGGTFHIEWEQSE